MLEIAVTTIALAVCLLVRRDLLGLALAAYQILGIFAGLVVTKSYLPGAYSILSSMLAITGVVLWHVSKNYAARAVGIIGLMQCAWCYAYAQTYGAGSWYEFAFAMNASFVAQCVIAAGGADGLGRIYDNFRGRFSDYRNRHKRSFWGR